MRPPLIKQHRRPTWINRPLLPTAVPKPLGMAVPYSHEEFIRRRAQLTAQAYMQSQAYSFMDPGLNPAFADRIREEYGLADDSRMKAAGQAIGAGAGLLWYASHIKKGGGMGAKIGSIAGPKGTAIGMAAGAIAGAISAAYTGAAIGGTLTPSGMYGAYDIGRDLILRSTQNPIGGAMHATTMVGNTMTQLKGSPVFKSAIVSLQEQGNMVDELNRAYGFHEEGFSRIDFSRIRKNTGLNLPFGNGIIDFIGEMVMDPINWESGAIRKITAAVTDASVVILSAESAGSPEMDPLRQAILQSMDAGTMKQIGQITLDSMVNEYEALENFKNLMKANPQIREILQIASRGQESQSQYINDLLKHEFSHYTELIVQTLSNEQHRVFTTIEHYKDLTQQNLKQMQALNPNFTGYEQLHDNLAIHFKRRGFDFAPMHLDMLQKQYPALRNSVDLSDLQNKALMYVANPAYAAGTDGVKKLLKAIRTGDARTFLLKHFGKVNQGRVPFIDIKDEDNLVSIKVHKEYKDKWKTFKEKTPKKRINDRIEEREKELQKLYGLKRNDEDLKDLYKKLNEVNRNSRIEQARLRKQIEEKQKQINIYHGDERINKPLRDVYKKRLDALKKIERPLKPEELENYAKYESAITAFDQIEAYNLMDDTRLEAYTYIKGLLDYAKVLSDHYEGLYKEQRLEQGIIEGTYKKVKWIPDKYNPDKRIKTEVEMPYTRSFYNMAENKDYLEWLRSNKDYQAKMEMVKIGIHAQLEQMFQDTSKDMYELLKSLDGASGIPTGENMFLNSYYKNIVNHPALKLFEASAKELGSLKSKSKRIGIPFLDKVSSSIMEKNIALTSEHEYSYSIEPMNVRNQNLFLEQLGHINESKYSGFEMELRHLGIDPHLIQEIRKVEYDPYFSGKYLLNIEDLEPQKWEVEDYQLFQKKALSALKENQEAHKEYIEKAIQDTINIKKDNKILGAHFDPYSRAEHLLGVHTHKIMGELENLRQIIEKGKIYAERDAVSDEALEILVRAMDRETLENIYYDQIANQLGVSRDRLFSSDVLDSLISLVRSPKELARTSTPASDSQFVDIHSDEYAFTKEFIGELDRALSAPEVNLGEINKLIEILEQQDINYIDEDVETEGLIGKNTFVELLTDIKDLLEESQNQEIDGIPLHQHPDYGIQDLRDQLVRKIEETYGIGSPILQKSTVHMVDEVDEPGYWGAEFDFKGHISRDEVEEFFKQTYGLDIDEVTEKRRDSLRYKLQHNLQINGQKIQIDHSKYEDHLIPEIAYLIETQFPEYRQLYNEIKNKKIDDYYKVQNLMEFYEQLASHFSYHQINQNTVRMEQLLNPTNMGHIDRLYKVFMGERDDNQGVYKLIHDVFQSIEEDEFTDPDRGLQEVINLKNTTLEVKNSMDMLARLMSNPNLAQKVLAPYTGNEKGNTFVGPFFDMIRDINSSGIFKVNSNGEMYYEVPKMVERTYQLKKQFEKREYPQEAIDFLFEDMMNKIINPDDPDSILKMGANSIYATGVYFNELNTSTIDEIYESLHDVYDKLEEMFRDEQRDLINRARGVSSGGSGKRETGYIEDLVEESIGSNVFISELNQYANLDAGIQTYINNVIGRFGDLTVSEFDRLHDQDPPELRELVNFKYFTRSINEITINKILKGTQAVDYDSEMPVSGHPLFLSEFKDEITSMRDELRMPLASAKQINRNLKFHLHEPSFVQQRINIDKPYNTGELVRFNAPYTLRQPKHTRHVADQKRLLKSWLDEKDEPFEREMTLRQYTQSLRDYHKTLSKAEQPAFQTFEEALEIYRAVGKREGINRYLTQKPMTRFDEKEWQAFDTETTSLKQKLEKSDAFQWGFFGDDDEYETKVIGHTITDALEKLTGITQDDVDKGSLLDEVIEKINHRLRDEQKTGLLGHNINFDLKRLETFMDTQGYSKVDTAMMARMLYGESIEQYTLETLIKELKDGVAKQMEQRKGKAQAMQFLEAIEKNEIEFHGALTDAEMTYYLFHHMLEDLEKQGIKHIESLDVDYFLQQNKRRAMYGKTISTAFGESGKAMHFDQDVNVRTIKEEIQELTEELKIMEKLPNRSEAVEMELQRLIQDLKTQVGIADGVYTGWDELKQVSMMDANIARSVSELVGEKELYNLTRTQKHLKDIGFDSTQGSYALMYYNDFIKDKEPQIEERLKEFQKEMEQYTSMSLDDVRKIYGLYKYRHIELPEGPIEPKALIQHYGTDMYEIRKAHRQIKADIDDLRKELGGYEKVDNLEVRTNSNIYFLMTSAVFEQDEELIKDYLNQWFGKEVDATTVESLTQEVMNYVKQNEGGMDWTDPLIQKLKGYSEGIPENWETLTDSEVKIIHKKKQLEAIQRGRGKNVQEQTELNTAIENLKQLVRERNIEKHQLTEQTVPSIRRKIKGRYTDEELKKMTELIIEIRDLQEKIPTETPKEKAYYKQEYKLGTAFEEFNKTRDQILDKIKKREKQIEETEQHWHKEIERKYGKWNDNHAYTESKAMTDLLLQENLDGFRELANKYPYINADEIIQDFEDNVNKAQRGKDKLFISSRRVKEIGEDGIARYKTVYDSEDFDFDESFLLSPMELNYDRRIRAKETQLMLKNMIIEAQQNDPKWEPGELPLRDFEEYFLKDEDAQRYALEKPRIERMEKLERFYNMDLTDIQEVFKDGKELQAFMDAHPEYKLVSVVEDSSSAAKDPSRYFIKKNQFDTEIALKSHRHEAKFEQFKKIEMEAVRAGEYQERKPVAKELLYRNTEELDDLFQQYNPDEVSIGIMSTDDFKSAKEISYKPYELPGTLDWYYRNFLRLQKSDILVNSSWHLTNIVDIARKNSQIMEGIWDTRDYVEKIGDSWHLYHYWDEYRKAYIEELMTEEGKLDIETNEAIREQIINRVEQLGHMQFGDYIKEKYQEGITKEKIETGELGKLGTHVFQKWKNSKSFKAKNIDQQVAFLNEELQNMIVMLAETNEFQMTSAATDMPRFLQYMELKKLEESKSHLRNAFRWLSYDNPVMHNNMRIASRIEQTGRLHGYLLDRHMLGTSKDSAIARSLQRHFDYSDRSLTEMYGMMIFPFIAFPTRNALFWQKQLQSAAQNRRYYHLLNAAWGRFDTEQNDYAQFMQSKGYVPIGNTLVKIGDSRSSALNMGTNFGQVAYNRLNPLLRAPIEALRGDTDRGTAETLMQAVPILRRAPQLAGQARQIREQGLSPQTTLPGLFGTIYDDWDHNRPVHRQHRNIYNQLYNSRGQYRRLSNNAYYRTRQIMYQIRDRRR